MTPPVRCGRRPLSAALRAWPQVAAAFRQHDLTSWFPRITRCLPSAAPGLAAAGWGGCRRLRGCPWGPSGSGLPSPIAPEHRLPRAGAGWVAQPLSVLQKGVWGVGARQELGRGLQEPAELTGCWFWVQTHEDQGNPSTGPNCRQVNAALPDFSLINQL